ncbi:hypothetical protein HDU67_003440 [Dinochytrium kinnereticum]|nr:hypothetical protein HDU67_003440 [Dinochytrium kinnereticum]
MDEEDGETATAIAGYVCGYVRGVLSEEAKRKQMLQDLSRDRPFVEDEDMAVASFGKISSEVITKHIGGYLKKILEVICLYGGEVVKFLGDAVLVTFGNINTLVTAIKRATLCCLHIMIRYPICEIERPTTVMTETWGSMQESAGMMAGDCAQKSFKLTLHVALTAGPMNHVIIGIPKERLDYVVDGVCLHDLGDIIDDAKSGELGISRMVWNLILREYEGVSAIYQIKDLPSAIIIKKTGLLDMLEYVSGVSRDYLLTGVSEDHGPTSIAQYKESDDSFAAKVYPVAIKGYRSLPEVHSMETVQIMEKFVNKSIVHKLKTKSTIEKEILDRNNTQKVGSAVKTTKVISSEFRQLNIVFVKMKNKFQPDKAQRTLSLFLKSLAKYGGVFQQYSVDDKGQTMLACFGLPPYTHENDARRALRASAEFCSNANKEDLGDIYTSVSTGELLFASIGSEYRCEASFLGDAVNVAARIIGLSMSKSYVICDEKTSQTAEGLSAKFLGEFTVKGKTLPLALFGVNLDSFPGNTEDASDFSRFVGYTEERECLSESFGQWQEKGKQVLIMVEGASGMGKSKLLENFSKVVEERGGVTCLTQGSEVDLWTPYYGLRSLMSHIFRFKMLNSEFRFLANDKMRIQGSISIRSISTSNSRAQSLASEIQGGRLPHVSYIRRPSRLKKPITEDLYKYGGVEFLSMFGEDPRLAPLLNGVVPGIRIKDTDETKYLDGKARKALLTGMIVRIVQAFTADCKTVFVFDDAQWLDPISLEVLLNIVRFCPNSFFVFFTRPIEDMKFDFLRQVRQLENLVYRNLTGFTLADVEQLIINRYSFDVVKKVSERLKAAIFERGGSSPLASDMIMESLKLRYPDALQVTNEELDFAAETVNMDALLAKTVGAAITIQFDRVNVIFQEFLKRASILGQYFNISDVLPLLDMENATVEDIVNSISSYDRFHFLVISSSTAGNGNESEGEGDTGDCYFRHITIMNTIYDSLPFEGRQSLHLKAAQYFERLLEEHQDRSELLPVVSFHYFRSGAVEKAVVCLEELGMLHLKKFLFSECVSTIENLIAFVGTIDVTRYDLSQDFKQRLADPVRKSLWYSTLGMSFAQRRDFNTSLENILKCLDLLGVPWPRSDRQVRRATFKAGWEQYKLFKRTKGGSVACKLHPVLDSPARLCSLNLAVKALFSCSAYNPVMFSNDMKTLILFWRASGSFDMVILLCMCFIWVFMENSKASTAYEVFDGVVKFSRITGDVANEFCGLYYQSISNWLQGHLNLIPEILSQRIGAASQYDIIWPACGACSMLRAAMLQDNLDQMDSYMERIRIIVEQFKIPYFLPPLQMGKAWINYRNDNNPEDIVRVFVEMAASIAIWNEYAIAITEGVPSGAILIWLLVDQCLPTLHADGSKRVSAQPSQDPKSLFTLDQITRLRNSALSIAKITHTLQKNMFMEFVGLIGAFYDAAASMLQKGGHVKGITKLRNFLRNPKYAQRLKSEMQLVGALVMSFIGAYSDNEIERKAAVSEALALMNGFNAWFFVQWLKKKGAQDY